jgi:hypothetical protein
MRSASIAEWILARFTSRTRAASIVGDLLEASDRKGIAWFWLSAVPVLLSLALRACLAFSAAFCFGLFFYELLPGIFFGISQTHRPPHGWTALPDLVCAAGILLSFGMAYAAIRYGLRDPFTLQIVTAWGLACVFSVYWWMPIVQAACPLLGVSMFVHSMISAKRRRALMALVVALGLSFAGAALFSWYLTSKLSQISAMPGPLHMPWMALKQPAEVAFLLGLLLQPFIYSRVRSIFFGDHPYDGAEHATA